MVALTSNTDGNRALITPTYRWDKNFLPKISAKAQQIRTLTETGVDGQRWCQVPVNVATGGHPIVHQPSLANGSYDAGVASNEGMPVMLDRWYCLRNVQSLAAITLLYDF
jgi:hypothetical protein